MIGIAALAGFSAARLVDQGRKALPFAVATLAIPPATSAIVCLICLRDLTTCLSYLRGSSQLASGFSAAMSLAGSNLEFVAAAIALGLLLILLRMQAATSPAMARFYALLLAIPLFVSFKHGFVRQDIHVINFFCFVALSASLIALTIAFTRRHLPYLAVLILIPLTIRQDKAPSASVAPVVAEMLCLRSIHELVGAIPPSWLRERLAASVASYPADKRLEPIISAIGASPVASLSIVYTELAAAGVRAEVYPVIQRYWRTPPNSTRATPHGCATAARVS